MKMLFPLTSSFLQHTHIPSYIIYYHVRVYQDSSKGYALESNIISIRAVNEVNIILENDTYSRRNRKTLREQLRAILTRCRENPAKRIDTR